MKFSTVFSGFVALSQVRCEYNPAQDTIAYQPIGAENPHTPDFTIKNIEEEVCYKGSQMDDFIDSFQEKIKDKQEFLDMRLIIIDAIGDTILGHYNDAHQVRTRLPPVKGMKPKEAEKQLNKATIELQNIYTTALDQTVAILDASRKRIVEIAFTNVTGVKKDVYECLIQDIKALETISYDAYSKIKAANSMERANTLKWFYRVLGTPFIARKQLKKETLHQSKQKISHIEL
ncbi:hypothetical protein DSO57_1021581 [Entomophthora muscae]|uniref:Uncharacterized protein n=1 Tax=Entomophthora muscae TaxID=34485 RepID=A0ACC2TEC7_9FUNG|nr:hypothetical protein DSO57_1021581 [Entomophthora muscae]